MSEYQYYEFQAIDRPLTEKEMDELGELSTRAEITPTRFWNEYHWGNFKGNPQKMMERYFDAFLYFANWGTHDLMLRLPREVVSLDEIEPYCTSESLSLHKTKTHVILEFRSEDKSGDWDSTDEPSLAGLIALRTELLHGDLRSLYIAWLAGVQFPGYADDEDDDSIEPPVPRGLKSLSGAQQALTSFLRLDEDTLAVAAETSSPLAEKRSDSAELKSWVQQLPPDEKERLLIELVQGARPHLAMELNSRFLCDSAARRQSTNREETLSERRTVQHIRDVADHTRKEREHRRQQEEARMFEAAARRAAQERRKYLDELAQREENAWEEVVSLTEASRAKDYDRAVTLLKDLRDLGEHRGLLSRFEARLADVRAQRIKKPAFLRRLEKARLV